MQTTVHPKEATFGDNKTNQKSWIGHKVKQEVSSKGNLQDHMEVIFPMKNFGFQLVRENQDGI